MRSFKYFVQSTWLKEFVKQYAFVKKKKKYYPTTNYEKMWYYKGKE